MNVRAFALAAVAVGLLPAAGFAKPVAWGLDKAHTTVGFHVRHLGITKVLGSFSDFDAQVEADDTTGVPTKVVATAKVASIQTGVADRDNHLKAPDFFDAAKFPIMKAESRKITVQGNMITAEVNLTLRDVTKKVVFKGELVGVQKANFGKPQLRAGYSLQTTIKRKEFGLAFNAVVEGVSVVGDDVTIQLDVEVVRDL